MPMPLRAHRPDLAKSDNTFRCDTATVRMVLDWWQQNPARQTHSRVADAERRRVWGICDAAMGDNLVNDCRPFHLLALINDQPRIKKNNTRRRWNSTIQQPFNEAELLGLIVKNPFRGVSFPEGDQGRDWTDDELSAILNGANEPFAELVIGLRLSGLRPFEGCDLSWPQIRFDLGNIKIDKHKSSWRTKAPRIVPLNDPLIELLQSIQKRGYPGARVFRNTKHRPWTREHADSTFRRLRDRLGLPEDLKLHGCRHTFGTGAIINDVSVMKLMEILGHADIRTTQRYVHLVNKTDHLTQSMNQAVNGVKLRKATEYTPLFDGLE
jgi:integrase